MMTENFPQINVRHQSPDQEENPRTLSWINKKTLHLGIFWEKKKKNLEWGEGKYFTYSRRKIRTDFWLFNPTSQKPQSPANKRRAEWNILSIEREKTPQIWSSVPCEIILQKKRGVPAVAQWVKNLTTAA